MPRKYISFEESVRVIADKHGVAPRIVRIVLKRYFRVLKWRISEGFICKVRRLGTFSLNMKGKVMLKRSMKIEKSVELNKYYKYNQKRKHLKR